MSRFFFWDRLSRCRHTQSGLLSRKENLRPSTINSVTRACRVLRRGSAFQKFSAGPLLQASGLSLALINKASDTKPLFGRASHVRNLSCPIK